MTVGNFLYNKLKKDKENQAFQKWNENNQIKDQLDNPIIAFHGSVDEHFEVIDFDKSNDMWYVGKGFYSSSEISDVNRNYADLSQVWDLEGDNSVMGSDLKNRFYHLKEELSQIDINSESINDFFNISDIEDYVSDIDSPDISLENAQELAPGDYSSVLNEDGIIEWDDFIDIVAKNNFIKTSGWIVPVYVKMERPVYYTEDETATKILPMNSDIEEWLDIEEGQIEEFKDLIENFVIKVNESDYLDEEIDSREILYQVESYNGSLTEAEGEEVYNSIIEWIDILDTENEEDIKQILTDLFVDYDYLEIDEDEKMEFEPIMLGAVEIDNSEEEINLYKKIKKAVLNNSNEYHSECLEAFADFEGQIFEYSEDNTCTVHKLFKHFQNYENCFELLNFYNKGIQEIFDGVVLDAHMANNDWRMDSIPYGTKHYILFNENNAKFALYNNGDYSLTNNNMAARKSQKQKLDFEDYSEKKMMEDFRERFSKFRKLPNIEFVKSFKMEEDALIDTQNDKMIINLFKIQNREELDKIVTHELIGHYGLDLILNKKEKTKLLVKVANHYKRDGLKDMMKLYPELDYRKPKDRIKLAEEKICFYAEKHFNDDSFMNGVLNTIKAKFIKFKKAVKAETVEDDMFLTLYTAKKELYGNDRDVKYAMNKMRLNTL